MTRGSIRIMIVDEEKNHAVCFRAALERYGYAIDAFTDPLKALQAFCRGRYKVVIIDAKMREISGFEFARKIDGIDKEAKIIMMATFPISKQDFERSSPTRIDVFIKKPVGMTKLMDHLSVLSGNYKEGKWSIGTTVSSFIAGVATFLLSLTLEEGIPLFN